MRLNRLLLLVTSGLWFVPVVCVVVGALLSFGTIWLDRSFDYSAVPAELVGGPEAASAILQTIALSMVSLTALVLTITMVVVQLAMGQFSPRIVQRVLRDKPSQFAIGLFVATFVHAILALREVRVLGGGEGQVPGIAVVTAFVLVVASIAVLVLYVNHIGRSLRVAALIELVGKDTRRLLDRVYADHGDPPESPHKVDRVIPATRSGVIVKIGVEQLVRHASSAGCVLELVPSLGAFIPAGAPLFHVHGSANGLDPEGLRDALILRQEPTLDEDVAYGLRLLVDIAVRSLADSPFLDPTTAVQAIDRLHDILRQLVRRPFPDGQHRDAEGALRLIVPTMTWEAYVHLAFDEVRLAGAGSPQVARRLMAALLDLRALAPPARDAALAEQLALLTAGANRALAPADARLALRPDREGIGVAAGAENAEVHSQT